MEDALNAKIKRDAHGKLLPGHGLVSPGRPKGQSLKEYWRQKFADMTAEEKEAFSVKVSPEMIFRMAEGNPANATDLTSKGEKLPTPILYEEDNG